jgi:hypothetical protein
VGRLFIHFFLTDSAETVPRFNQAGRGGFMRRFFTLICLLGLAIPAGISLSGCTRNPAANYCNLDGISGYGLKITDIASITLAPVTAGISLSYGQTTQAQSPQGFTCKGNTANIVASQLTYGTTNNQIADISPTGNLCAGTWNRNTGGGIADYTVCNPPNPLPATNGLPYNVAYITASAASVTSNPVAVYVHAPITSITVVGPQQCLSQGQTATLDSQACYLQNGNQALLCAPASVTSSANPPLACPLPYVNGVNGAQVPISSIPSCTTAIGTMNYAFTSTGGTSSIATINQTTNVITAEQPGTAVITASISNTGSSAGYFSVCPPASISVALANGSTSGVVTQGVQQGVTTTVTDTKGNVITGLTLDYESTNPIDISIASGSNGTINANFPGVASVFAVCQPPSCNPAPINVVGSNGTGLSLASNPVNITTPGTASDFIWFGAPGQSQYFGSVELLTGVANGVVRLPYVPNSMIMDQSGNNIYFGSTRELMVAGTFNNSVQTQNTSVPGVVLAVSPDNSTLLINDQARHLFYIYSIANSGISNTFSGMGNAAAWTQDNKTLYITDNANLNTPAACGANPAITGHSDMLYVYNTNTGWTTYPLPPSPLPPSQIPSCSAQPNTATAALSQTPAVIVPNVGAYMRGNPTVAHAWCPVGTVTTTPTTVNSTISSFYPGPYPGTVATQGGDQETVQSDALASTFDGKHILGAQWLAGGNIELTDIGITIPSTTSNGITVPAACPNSTVTNGTTTVQTLKPLTISGAVNQVALTSVNATSVNQVVTGSLPTIGAQPQIANLAFVTYSGNTTGASLPYYIPSSTGGAGKLGYVSLTGSNNITAPVAGAFSPDNTLFFVSTAGDNNIHYINIPTAITTQTPLVDKQQISPNLPACTPVSAGGLDPGCVYGGAGTMVPAEVITVKPRSTT